MSTSLLSSMIRPQFRCGQVESAFLQWCNLCAGSHPICGSSLWWNKSSTGNGLFAGGKISRGSEILRVPDGLWKPYSAEYNTVSLHKENPSFFNGIVGISSKLMPNYPKQALSLVQSTCLALRVMSEVNHPIQHSYVGVMRNSTFPSDVTSLPHPLLMDTTYLDYLKNTSCYDSIISRRRMYSYVAQNIFDTNEDNELTNLFKWSMGIILSRGLSGEGFPFSLVPILDFVNHDGVNPNAEHSFDRDNQSFVLTASRNIEPDEEITISYGSGRSTESFMTMYGFLGDSDNPNDFINIDISEKLFINNVGMNAKSLILLELQSESVAKNVLSTKHGLRVRHAVTSLTEELKSVLSRVCEKSLEHRNGFVGSDADVHSMIGSIVKQQIRDHFLMPEKLAAFGVSDSLNSETATLTRLMEQMRLFQSDKSHIKSSMDYWRHCSACVSLKELDVLLALSSSL